MLSLSYEEFYCRLLREVQHLRKLSSSESLRLIVLKQDRSEIDIISPKYFQSQMTKLIDTGSKTIVIRVTVNESPLNVTLKVNSKCETSSQSKSKRRLELMGNQQPESVCSRKVSSL